MKSLVRKFLVLKSPYQHTILALVCIGMFVIPAIISRLTGTKHNELSNWKPASFIVPASLIQKAVSQNSNANNIDIDKIKALKFNRGKGGLYLFDFNSLQLCGAGGCLYAVYRETGEKLLSLLVNPNLPKGETLFRLDDAVENGLPCLIITQAATTPQTVLRSQYCYKGQGFIRVNEALTPVR